MADNTMNLAELQKYKVIDLRRLLKDRGLSRVGNKPELIARLQTTPESTEDGLKTDLADPSDDILNAELDDSKEDEEEEEDDDGDEKGEDDEEDEEAEEGGSAENGTAAEEAVPPISPIPSGDAAETPKDTVAETTAETTQAAPPGGSLPVVRKMSADERLADRAKRFGAVSESSKAALRAQRFGVADKTASSAAKPATSAAQKGEDLEKLKKRAGRFGTTTSTTLVKSEDLDKLKKRADRFGTTTSATLVKIDSDDRLQKRLARFGATSVKVSDSTATETTLKRKQKFDAVSGGTTGESQAKLQKRAERFKVVQ